MPKMLDLESTFPSRSTRLADKHKQKCGLFVIISLALVGACEVDKNPHIFLIREKYIFRKLINTLMGP